MKEMREVIFLTLILLHCLIAQSTFLFGNFVSNGSMNDYIVTRRVRGAGVIDDVIKRMVKMLGISEEKVNREGFKKVEDVGTFIDKLEFLVTIYSVDKLLVFNILEKPESVEKLYRMIYDPYREKWRRLQQVGIDIDRIRELGVDFTVLTSFIESKVRKDGRLYYIPSFDFDIDGSKLGGKANGMIYFNGSVLQEMKSLEGESLISHYKLNLNFGGRKYQAFYDEEEDRIIVLRENGEDIYNLKEYFQISLSGKYRGIVTYHNNGKECVWGVPPTFHIKAHNGGLNEWHIIGAINELFEMRVNRFLDVGEGKEGHYYFVTRFDGDKETVIAYSAFGENSSIRVFKVATWQQLADSFAVDEEGNIIWIAESGRKSLPKIGNKIINTMKMLKGEFVIGDHLILSLTGLRYGIWWDSIDLELDSIVQEITYFRKSESYYYLPRRITVRYLTAGNKMTFVKFGEFWEPYDKAHPLGVEESDFEEVMLKDIP